VGWLEPIILATWEVEIGRIKDEASLGEKRKKITRACLDKWLGTVVFACHPSYDPISKITNAKRAGR
jgi:hypothetical protein